MKRILIIVSSVIGLAVLGVLGAGLTMSERDLATILKSVPGLSSHAEDIAASKRGVSTGVSYWIDDTVYTVRSTWRDIINYSPSDRTPRVVIELEPVRTPVMMSDEAVPPGEAVTPPPAAPINHDTPVDDHVTPALDGGQHQAEPSKEAAAPEPMSAADPAPSTPLTQTAMPAPAPAMAMAAAETRNHAVAKADTAKAPTIPALHPPKPVPAPAPAPAPAPKVTAAVAKKIDHAPPPPAPKTDNGTAAHKKGLAYYKGVGVRKNFKSARKYFIEAANKGHADAQYNLGIMSYLGQGTEQNYKTAAKWFRMAADQDQPRAQYNLGFLYFEGKGVEKDKLQAFMWIDRAAEQKDENAIKARDALRKSLPKDIFTKNGALKKK